jgi:phospholipase C
MGKTGFDWNFFEYPLTLADVSGNGRCDIVGFGVDGVWVARSDGTGGFLPPLRLCENFSRNKGSWHADQHVRLVGEVTGRQPLTLARTASAAGVSIPGRRFPGDLVGFGDQGVWIALNNGQGVFGDPQLVVPNFGVQQSWRVDRDVRMLADLTGKGHDSIVGFGEEGVWFAINDGHAGFGSPRFFPDFGFNKGWRLKDHPRFAAALSESGCADFVGFGNDGVWVAFNDGQGGFAPPAVMVCNELCFNRGWGAEHPRFAARLTQNPRGDLVGFGNDGVWAAFNQGNHQFTPQFVLSGAFGFNAGWRVERHLRFVVDLTGKGQADLIGFGDDDVWVALNDGTGKFGPAQRTNINNFCANQGWAVGYHPRFLADVTGNGLPDIVGFGNDGVWVALNNGNGTFGQANYVLNDFGVQTLKGITHVFVMMMENRSFDHMLGMSGITGTDAETGQPTQINGLTGSESNSTWAGKFSVKPGALDMMPVDPGHEFLDTLVQLTGKDTASEWMKNPGPYPPSGTTEDNSGFAQSYLDNGGPDLFQVMKCFGPGELPVLQQLAKEFAVCDQWFSSLPGPTWPNRFFAHAATSGNLDDSPTQGDIAKWELAPSAGFGFHNGTIYDALNSRGIRYKLYSADEYPVVSGLKGVSNDFDIGSMESMVGDIKDPDFANIFYIHIEPFYAVFTDYQHGNSQHPVGSVAMGEAWIKQIYEIIRNSPVWERSMLILTWDEHGGFYDHCAPPVAVPPGDPDDDSHNKHGFRFDRLGVRVPAIVISPWIPKNIIDHRIYDHSSIPATIERFTGIDPLTQRDRYANSVTTLLTLPAPRTDAPTTLVAALPPAAREAPTEGAGPVRPNASIDEGEVAAFLATAVAQHLKVVAPEERQAIFRRVGAIRTHAEAWAYMQEVRQKVATVRAANEKK